MSNAVSVRSCTKEAESSMHVLPKLVCGHVCPSTSLMVKHAKRLCWPFNVTTVDFNTTSVHEAVCPSYHDTVTKWANWPVWPLKITTASFSAACVCEAKQSAFIRPATPQAAVSVVLHLAECFLQDVCCWAWRNATYLPFPAEIKWQVLLLSCHTYEATTLHNSSLWRDCTHKTPTELRQRMLSFAQAATSVSAAA